MKSILKKDILYSQLKEKIRNAEYKPGEKLPNELDFSRELGVAKITLRSALSRLEEEGLIIRERAKGTIINPDIKRKRILVIIPARLDVESPYHVILPGIEEKARDLNIELEKCQNAFFCELENKSRKEFISSGKFLGIIFPEGTILGHEESFLAVKSIGLPTVMPHANYKDYITTGFACIYPDERKAFADALKYLAEKGHVSVATVFNKTLTENYSRSYSLNEYLETLKKTGLTGAKELVSYCAYNREDVKKAVHGFLKLGTIPTAILCGSDFYALHVYEVLKELNIEIPKQMAVMGYANYPGGRFFTPSLSTVDLSMKKAGETAVELLDKSSQWWGDEKSPPFITVEHEIIARESTNTIRTEKIFLNQKIKGAL